MSSKNVTRVLKKRGCRYKSRFDPPSSSSLWATWGRTRVVFVRIYFFWYFDKTFVHVVFSIIIMVGRYCEQDSLAVSLWLLLYCCVVMGLGGGGGGGRIWGVAFSPWRGRKRERISLKPELMHKIWSTFMQNSPELNKLQNLKWASPRNILL